MENQRTEYIQPMTMNVQKVVRVKEMAIMSEDFTTRVGTLELKVLEHVMVNFSPTVFERYQRMKRHCSLQCLEMYVSGVSTRKVSKIVEELCENLYRNLCF